jgi:hypothetical protein
MMAKKKTSPKKDEVKTDKARSRGGETPRATAPGATHTPRAKTVATRGLEADILKILKVSSAAEPQTPERLRAKLEILFEERHSLEAVKQALASLEDRCAVTRCYVLGSVAQPTETAARVPPISLAGAAIGSLPTAAITSREMVLVAPEVSLLRLEILWALCHPRGSIEPSEIRRRILKQFGEDHSEIAIQEECDREDPATPIQKADDGSYSRNCSQASGSAVT